MGLLDGKPDRYDLVVPVGHRNGRVVLVSWGIPASMTELEWEQMLSILEAMKPGIVAGFPEMKPSMPSTRTAHWPPDPD